MLRKGHVWLRCPETPVATCGAPLKAGVGLVMKGAKGQSAGWKQLEREPRGREGQATLGDDGRGLSLQSLDKERHKSASRIDLGAQWRGRVRGQARWRGVSSGADEKRASWGPE